jgi:hypothetical protein
MGNTLAKRGLFQVTEASTPADASVTERIQSVLRRIEDQPCDMPVVVSAGFLRWMGEAHNEFADDQELVRLRDQIVVLIQERDEAREESQRLKAHRDGLSTQIQPTDVRIISLAERMANTG